MTRVEVERAVNAELAKRKTRVLNRNAIAAAFSAFDDPVGALGKIFLGRGEALDQERQKIVLEAVLELVTQIDAAISKAQEVAANNGVTIAGSIVTHGVNADLVVGVDVGCASVTFAPGTRVETSGNGVRSVTGVKIGGSS